MNTAVRARSEKPKMSIQLKHAPKRMPLSAIKAIADNASGMLVDVRESMLAPHPRKNPPVFTTAQVGTLCRIDRQRANYFLRAESELPQGTLHGSGRSREFSLAEARVWIDKVAPFTKRPTGVKGKKIAIGNFKGGVSKTTSAMSLAQGLSPFGRRLLIIDM